MTEICRQHCLVRLVAIVLTSRLVFGYENAYDLAERRNQYGGDPNNRYYQTSERYYNRYQDRDRYSTHNQRPSSVYSTVRPINSDPGFVLSRRSSSIGNGYDNLGNSGIGSVRQRDWNRFLEPRGYDTISDRTRFDEPRRWETTRRTDLLDDRRPLQDSFRTRGRFDDRRGIGSFRSGDSFNDRRSIDPIRDGTFEDRLPLDSSWNSDRLDDRRTGDTFRDPSRRIASDTLDPTVRLAADTLNPTRGAIIDTLNPVRAAPIDTLLDTPRLVDIPRRSSPLENDEFTPRLRPSIQRRSDYPEFYRKDYFVPQAPAGEKSAGFETENSDKNFQSAAGEKENSGISTVGSYVTSNEDKNQKKTDTGFNENKEGAKLDVANKEKIGETTRFDKNGGNKSTVRSNRVTKKGHSTKGFATHHHKDETGNTTTFFDESSDSGGQSDYQG